MFHVFFSFLKTIIPRARSRKLGTKMGPVFGSSRSTSIWRLRIRSLQEEKAFVIKNQVMGVMGPWINVIFFQMWCFTLTLFRMAQLTLIYPGRWAAQLFDQSREVSQDQSHIHKLFVKKSCVEARRVLKKIEDTDWIFVADSCGAWIWMLRASSGAL